jgi:hypothetical protein
MQRIPLVDAEPDMILATDVVNDQQMLLLKKGTALSAKNIKMLKSWGVSAIDIEAGPIAEPNIEISDRTTVLAEIEVRMLKKFEQLDDDEVMHEIRRVATDIVTERFHHQDTSDAG